MAKRYAIWDKRSPVITPVGEVLTAEQWMARYPVSALPDITVVCAAGEMNGAFFGTLGQMRSAFENRGADFSRCETQEDALLVMEAFEDAENAASAEPSAAERTAAALEFMAINSMPDME